MVKKVRYWNGRYMVLHENILEIEFNSKSIKYESIYGGEDTDEINKNYPLLYFIGLKDINGQEIYEGDIVAMYKYDEFGECDNFKGVVVYDKERVAFTIKDEIYSLYNIDEYTLIRIGSVFEIKEYCKISDDLEIDKFNNLLSISLE